MNYKIENTFIHSKRFIAASLILVLWLITISINAQSTDEAPAQPKFSSEHGYYDSPFPVEITSDISNAQIYYTNDGSEPGKNNGTLYTSPVQINTTTVLRAVVIKKDSLISRISTSTYIFLDDVINQPNNPPGYPSEWGPYTAIPGTAVADYEMDPDITRDPKYSIQIKESLLVLPVMSIVTDKDNLFSHSTDPDKGGIYIYTGPPEAGDKPGLGIDWARPASIEFFNRDGSDGFQADCELKIHGGHSRRNEKTPKHSFRLTFNSNYGISKLDFPLFGNDAAQSINTFILRATYGNTWLHMSKSERDHAQLIRDLWGKDTQLEMGHPSGHGIYVHLYINGLYWGIYNPTERIDNDFASEYIGGNEEDFDVIKDYVEVVNGNSTAWNNMFTFAKKGLSGNASYQRFQGKNPDGTDNPSYENYLDMVNFIDYMIINFYGANWDWDHHNWIAARNSVLPGKGFKFFSWDAEHILESVSSNILNENNNNCPSQMFQLLRENNDFKLLLADRIQFHCFNGGALTPDKALERWKNRSDQIELAIIAESARWGDYRRDIHPYTTKGDLYTKEHWLTEKSFMINEYFPKRTGEFIKQLKQAGLFPNTNAPQFLINGKQPGNNKIVSGDMLSMSVSSGSIYYTNDGTDPYDNGSPSLNAAKYSSSVKLNNSTRIKARTLNGTEWSALNEVYLVIPEEFNNLKVTEIHYHPLDQDTIDGKSFEFIELKNIGAASINLDGVQFVNGITYTFSAGTSISPGGFIFLASDKEHFQARYGSMPFDEYSGSLDNSGERIVLTTASNDTIVSIRYNDKDPWPVNADGGGYSLVPKEVNPTGDQNDAANWRASYNVNGSPGADDLPVSIDDNDENILSTQFELYQNYPNPFNPETVIEYMLPVRSLTTLKIYDILGREVTTIVNKIQEAGVYNFRLSTNKFQMPSGIYFYKLTAGNFVRTRKMILLK